MELEELFRLKPLSAFSIYTQGQADYLVGVGKKLCEKFDTYDNVIDDFSDTYGLFWLWVLGAYEVIRTLSQHSGEFEPGFVEELLKLKKFIAEVRMPFAKQQYRGREEFIFGDLSVVGCDKDFKFVIDGKPVSARKVIDRFVVFIESIELKHIDQNYA